MLKRLRATWRRLRYWLFPTPCYVVIYDFLEENGYESEFYYGYFNSITEAKRMYAMLIEHQEHLYSNARVCLSVKVLSGARS